MKSKSVAYILWLFLGLFGVHRFYLGHVWYGIFFFFTFGIFGIGWIVDAFLLGQEVDLYNSRQIY